MVINKLRVEKFELKLKKREELRGINEKIREEKRRGNKRLKKKYKKWFLLLDIAMILIIMSNLGATLITNALVMKVGEGEPLPVLKEINPVVAKNSGYVPAPQANTLIIPLITFLVVWGIVTSIYFLYRNTIYLETQLYGLTFFVITYGIIFGWDFTNDFGFLVGKIIFT